MIISRSFHLRMRRFSDKLVEKIKIHFLFGNYYSKIVPFMR
jgi:hypothetical protein